MYKVYVLRSLKDQKFYIGMTSNLDDRLKKHKSGGVPSTKFRRPLILVYSEEIVDREPARKREKFLKSGPGHKELLRFIEDASRKKNSG